MMFFTHDLPKHPRLWAVARRLVGQEGTLFWRASDNTFAFFASVKESHAGHERLFWVSPKQTTKKIYDQIVTELSFANKRNKIQYRIRSVDDLIDSPFLGL